jgi:urease accessory protein
MDTLIELDLECNAVKLPSEIRMASQKIGIRLNKIFTSLVKNDFSDLFLRNIEQKIISGHYCISFGLFAAIMCIDKEDVLNGFLYNTSAALVTNCVKLVPLSQQAGQEILFLLLPLLKDLAKNAMKPDKDRIGSCCPGLDIRSMQHEQLYSRLYMS